MFSSLLQRDTRVRVCIQLMPVEFTFDSLSVSLLYWTSRTMTVHLISIGLNLSLRIEEKDSHD